MPREIEIRPASGRADFEAWVALQREVWGLSDLVVTSAIQLLATVHAGGLLLVADGGDAGIAGFCYAFAALRAGEPHLHSDMLAVRRDARGQRPAQPAPPGRDRRRVPARLLRHDQLRTAPRPADRPAARALAARLAAR